MLCCKNCQSDQVIKNGFVRKKARYKCKSCGYNFVLGDARLKKNLAVKKALAVILYSLGKASFGFLAKLFGVSRTLTYKWIRKEADLLEEPIISEAIKEIEFDELWHFIGSKKTSDGSSRRWIVAKGKPLPGLQVVVMLQHSGDSMKRLSI
jgi:transposase-like protein